jgi:hypothetical protein
VGRTIVEQLRTQHVAVQFMVCREDQRALVRLVLDTDVALARLRLRHGENAKELEWHERRHPELAGILERVEFGDELVLDSSSLAVTDIAAQIADRIAS